MVSYNKLTGCHPFGRVVVPILIPGEELLLPFLLGSPGTIINLSLTGPEDRIHQVRNVPNTATI